MMCGIIAGRALPRTSELSQPEGLALARDFDELEQIEEKLLETRLAGQESVEAYLYVILPDEHNKLPKPVIGPTSDFVQQLVRRLNRASKGKINLQLLAEPPVVSDFTRDGRPWVRVIQGAVDKATGEIRFGIKEQPARNSNSVNVAHTQAIRRCFEIHPGYNRKVVARFIREKLRELGYDPAKFLIQGTSGGGEWSRFFALAKGAGVDSKALRAGVRERTGKGLSEVATAEDADRAAQAIHETVTASASAGSEDTAAPGSLAQDAPTSGPVADPAAISRLRCEEYIEKIGLPADRVDRLWRHLKVLGDSKHPSVQRRRYDAFLQLLQALSTGTSEAEALRAAVEVLQSVPQPVGAQR